ncbi:phosphotransferase family protein [Embleya hyalina]|uniref:phosphotransferase family protein n=1 Tax=Embleya hyalina TaxID=516124 RepID=UPI000F818658|nr:aminoglycoside phosphotransferase family protein [Embleya hyalina]
MTEDEPGGTPAADRILTRHAALLARLLPTDPPAALTVRQGQFHHVVMGASRVVCLARTDAAERRLPRRAALIRLLGGLSLGVRTPRLLDAGEDPGYLLLDRLPGVPLAPDAAVPSGAAAQYADLLTALTRAAAHPEVRAAFAADRSEVPAPTAWSVFAADVRAELYPLMSPTGRGRADAELGAVQALSPVVSALVHGDLGGDNLLWTTVDGTPRLSGVLDWDEVSLGDPAEDLAAIAATHGDALVADVLDRMGRRDAATSTRIAAIRGTFALQQALSALRDGDRDELADGLSAYR